MEAFDDFKRQCGEIYLLTTGHMTFHCTLCDNKFNGFNDFAEHVNLLHLNEYISVKGEIPADIDGYGEDTYLPMAVDSVDFDDEKPIVYNDMETQFNEKDELSFEFTYAQPVVEEKHNIPAEKDQNDVTKALGVIAEGEPRKIVSHRLKNKDLNSELSKHNRFSCTVCDYSTNRKSKLVEHVRRHFGDKPFSCDFCDKRFYMQNEKTKHTARLHSNTDELKEKDPCADGTGVKIRRVLTRRPVNMNVNPKYATRSLHCCTECDYKTISKTRWTEHLRRHSGERPFSCDFCELSCYTSNERKRHIARKHPETIEEQEPEPKKIKLNYYNINRKFQLEEHEEQYQSEPDEVKEQDPAAEEIGVKVREVLSRRPPTRAAYRKLPARNLNFCTECDYKTVSKTRLAEHLRRHSGERPFSCDFCELSCYTSNERKRHIARQHPEKVEEIEPSPETIKLKNFTKSLLIDLGDNKFQCQECNFISFGRTIVLNHIRRHSTYKPRRCSLCPKTFFTNTELDFHTRSHTGEKPYLCTVCGNVYSKSSYLNTHLKRHHNTRDKECPICKRCFFDFRQLQSHMAVHSDERPFACEVCSSTFKRQKSLSLHMKSHLNGQAFQCEICDAGFRQHAKLVAHINEKHTLTS